MKRNLKFIAMAVVMIAVFLLSLCGCGYNRLMRDHLSAPDNYFELELEIVKVYARCAEPYNGDIFPEITNSNDIDVGRIQSVFIDCKYIGGKTDNKAYDDEFYASGPILRFEIVKSSVVSLISTDFFDVIKTGGRLFVRSTVWIYMDGEFNYFAEIIYDGVTYLAFEEGLKNIVDMMESNKSLF